MQNQLIGATAALALVLSGCATSRAPEAELAAAAEEDASNIVVTGSLIRRGPSLDLLADDSLPPPPPPPPAPYPNRMAPQAMAVAPSPQPVTPPGIVATPHPEIWTPPVPRDVGRDRFTSVAQNAFKLVADAPVSTFSIDVDTASYSFVRASLASNVLPPPAAVRAEEMINYFPYDYPTPASRARPFGTQVSVMPSPFAEGRKLVRIGIRGYDVARSARPRANLVFLIDTSGSMQASNKLALVQQSLAMLLDRLDARDRVAIVTYAGSAGTVLEPTPASEKAKIRAALDRLQAGGSTAGAEGIRQAYRLAEANFDPKGVNRVMLATDGDFNVGITDPDALKGFVEREREKGVYLSVLGFGMGNYNDAMMQTLAQNGNGVAAYIDRLGEARKTLVEEDGGTLFPIATDVKIQVEFNPAAVTEYRLIGYETRMLAREDFDNDTVDAGDVGSGQTVTALYEIVPVGGPRVTAPLRYGGTLPAKPAAAAAAEYGFVKIRYKQPGAKTSQLIATPIGRGAEVARFEDAPADARFAVGVAAFAELLRGGKYRGKLDYDAVLRIANGARGDDPFGYRAEFVQLVRQAKAAPSLAALGRR